MVAKSISWQERLKKGKTPVVKLLDFDFAGLKRGTTMVVSSPYEVDRYIRSIPFGETRSIHQMRADLARDHGADATCPASTPIFLRVVSEAAFEQVCSGASLDSVAPFWRIVEPGSRIAQRLACGDEFLQLQREHEGIT